MRKMPAFVLSLLLAAAGLSQELVRNPAKPLNPEAGRVLKLEPVLEIRDAGGEFYFKYPYLFDIDARGRFLDSFYVNVEGELMLADGDFIYVTEKDEDENILVRKYKVLNGPGA